MLLSLINLQNNMEIFIQVLFVLWHPPLCGLLTL